MEAVFPGTLTIIKGHYSLRKASLPAYCNPPDKHKRHDVWRLEEKQTDVNIALDSYRDAARGDIGQVVFVSNDVDLEPALKAIREDCGDRVAIGVILPLRKGTRRPPSQSLMKWSDWTRRYLLNEELSGAHLPTIIPRRRKDIRKPDHW